MKILHIITRLILGGAQQNTVLCCAAQRRAAHRVTLAFGPIYGPEGSLLAEAQASGAALKQVRSLQRHLSPVRDLLCYGALRRLIHKIRPDVVHTHSSKAGILGRAAAWAERVPAVIHTVHGLPFHDRQPRFVQRAYVAAETWAARRCHYLIAIAPAMVESFSAAGVAGPRRFAVIPSGMDLKGFPADAALRPAVRRELGIPAAAPVLGIVARLDPLKGHDDLLDIFPDLLARMPRLRMLLVGDGQRRRHLERRIHDEGLGNRVMLCGLVPHHEVGRLLSAVDVKVLPSYQEGQSRTLIEALLCGCGIVAYNVGGIGSVCIDGQTGRLVTVGDRATLLQTIVWMFDHPHQRRALTERGRDHVHRLFDSSVMVEMIERVYRQVLERP